MCDTWRIVVFKKFSSLLQKKERELRLRRFQKVFQSARKERTWTVFKKLSKSFRVCTKRRTVSTVTGRKLHVYHVQTRCVKIINLQKTHCATSAGFSRIPVRRSHEPIICRGTIPSSCGLLLSMSCLPYWVTFAYSESYKMHWNILSYRNNNKIIIFSAGWVYMHYVCPFDENE